MPASKNRLARREVAGAAAVLLALVLVAIGAGSRGSASVHIHLGRAAGVVVITLLVLLGIGIAVVRLARTSRRVIARRVAVTIGILAVVALLTWWIGPGAHGKLSLGKPPSLPPSHSSPPASSSSNGTSVQSPLLAPLPLVVGGLVVVLLAVAVVLALRSHRRGRPDDEEAATRQAVYAAVDAGEDAMRDLLDPRAAIIACYAAMEHALATAGVRRLAAETPNDLLARAAALNRAPAAAARLTELFLEARYSTHPMSAGDRQAARGALIELREPRPTATSAGLQ